MNVTMTDSSSSGKILPFRKAPENILIDCIGSADKNLVSWQSVYFALVALAVYVMTQPCGRVCGQNSKMRTYMRSSLIFCGFDALAIIIRILVYRVNRITPFRAIQSTVAARFDDIDDELEGLQMLEKLTFIRLVLFILTLTQSIKLFALGRVPWPRSWGCLFLISFVVVEIVIFLGQSFERVEISKRSCLPQ
jgi:hypothetical protein